MRSSFILAAPFALLFAASPARAQTAPSPPPACAPVPACPDVALEPGPRRPFRHTKSKITTSLGSPRHRARDLFQRAGTPQVLGAKFNYGKLHKDLEDEEIDVYVLRGCSGTWEKLGTTRTSERDEPSPFPGMPSGSGRILFEIPKEKTLSEGLHRIRFVVAGDGSSVDALAEILSPSSKFFVSDVDGTLTVSENTEVGSVLRGIVSRAHEDAPRVLTALAEKGYRPLYLSARADWLTARTREFLAFRGFPLGAIRVTTTGKGETGEEAAQFKSAELVRLVAQGLIPSFGFGNKPSDTNAYEQAQITPKKHRFFLGVSDPNGGRRFESYADLLPEVRSLLCR